MPDWIGQVDFDPATSAKIRMKHGLTDAQVAEAVTFGHAEQVVWREDTPYGPRLMVVGTALDGTRLKAFLRPVDRADGHWECMTAIRV